MSSQSRIQTILEKMKETGEKIDLIIYGKKMPREKPKISDEVLNLQSKMRKQISSLIKIFEEAF